MKKRTGIKNQISGLYIAPAMIVLILCLILPLIYTIYCSLYSLDYLVQGDFLGLGNYINLLSDKDIIESLGLTVFITVISTALSVFLGLVLALWIDRKTGLFAYLIEMFGLVP